MGLVRGREGRWDGVEYWLARVTFTAGDGLGLWSLAGEHTSPGSFNCRSTAVLVRIEFRVSGEGIDWKRGHGVTKQRVSRFVSPEIPG